MAANDSSNKRVIKQPSATSSVWIPELERVRCSECGDEDLGPWVPLGHRRYLCEDCWDILTRLPYGWDDRPTSA